MKQSLRALQQRLEPLIRTEQEYDMITEVVTAQSPDGAHLVASTTQRHNSQAHNRQVQHVMGKDIGNVDEFPPKWLLTGRFTLLCLKYTQIVT